MKVLLKRINNIQERSSSLFISPYRESYNTQHFLLRLLEEWREHFDNNKTVEGILTDLSKAFDCFSHDLLLPKLTLILSSVFGSIIW